MSVYKPAGPHNHLLAPGLCLCVDCCRIVDGLRCSARSPEGDRCGNYQKHRGMHTLMIATTFSIVDERLSALDQEAPRWHTNQNTGEACDCMLSPCFVGPDDEPSVGGTDPQNGTG